MTEAEKTELMMRARACVNAASIRLGRGLEPALMADLEGLAAEYGLSRLDRSWLMMVAVSEVHEAGLETSPDAWGATVEALVTEVQA